jgi:hypothetical protein
VNTVNERATGRPGATRAARWRPDGLSPCLSPGSGDQDEAAHKHTDESPGPRPYAASTKIAQRGKSKSSTLAVARNERQELTE